MKTVVVLVVWWLGAAARAHELFLGTCPKPAPMKDFDMEKFEGLWYVVETFDDREECLTWTITRGPENGTWHLREAETKGVLSTVGLSNTGATTATLRPSSDNPAKMRVRWPLNLAGSYDFTVYSTDYQRFAGVFMCQQVVFFQRQNGVVLSRTPHLWVKLQQTARLSLKGVKMEYYQPVKQAHCGRPGDAAGPTDHGPLATTNTGPDEDNPDSGA